jgi:hypothetical protein
VESLNGYIVMMAKKQGIAAPANTRLVKQVNRMVRRRDRSGLRKELEEKLEGVVQVALTLVVARCLAAAVAFLPGNQGKSKASLKEAKSAQPKASLKEKKSAQPKHKRESSRE